MITCMVELMNVTNCMCGVVEIGIKKCAYKCCIIIMVATAE